MIPTYIGYVILILPISNIQKFMILLLFNYICNEIIYNFTVYELKFRILIINHHMIVVSVSRYGYGGKS